MFGAAKPAFGATTANFGSFNSGTTAASPFSSFKPTTGTSAFGAPPAFGATATQQPAAGGGLFGATNTSGGLFGNTAASTSTSGFGASTSGFGFGASTSTGGGLFGATTSTGLFGNTQNQSAFGAKPAGFGFGSTATPAAPAGSLFGATQPATTGLFGQQNNTLGGGGLFSNNTSAFGQPQQTATGTAHVKYNPVVGTDVVVKSGTSQNVNIKHHCITCMKEYENKSLEELRLEDYVSGRKGQSGGGMFGGFQQPTENKPLFGGTTSFAQPATTSAPSVFGGGGLTTSGFGQTGSFSFGGAQTNTAAAPPLFGAAKPAFGTTANTGTGLFGATTTQAGATTFGTTTPAFGFGATTQPAQQAGGLFGAKPATTGFGAQPASSGFGAFGAGGGGLFGAKTTAPTFGTTAPAFGTLGAGGFGTSTSAAGGGLFGANNSFGKPATTQPAFGFNTQPTLGGGLGTGLGTSFAAKPAAPAFGALGGTNMFGQPQQNNNTFKTGLEGGLGGGLFNTSAGLGGSALGMGALGANTNTMANSSLTGASVGGNVHEQILTLAARPYGDSPLFKDLLPDSSLTAEEVLKPTNPVAVQAVLDSSCVSAYRLTSPKAQALKLQHKPLSQDKKSLFDGLEESDASLEDKLSLKPSRKRLVLRPNQRNDLHDSVDRNNDSQRSIEERPQSNGGSVPSEREIERPVERESPANADQVDRARRQVNFGDNNADASSDRNGSWLSASKAPWIEKEKSIDGEPTPRLYPNIDSELRSESSERRASWLTTKPLRKPLVSNPDSAENSVRELGVRVSTHEQIRDLLQKCYKHYGQKSNCFRTEDLTQEIAELYVPDEENIPPRDAPPHPTGVKLTRPGYYTIPSLDEMIAYMRTDGSCVVPHLTIGRKNYGNVYYDCEIDVAGMDLDKLVHFLNKEVIVYPEDSEKPPLGTGLNRRAVVTLDRVWPQDKTEKRPITEPERLIKMDYEGKLRRVCDKHDTKFIEYRPATGSWVFRVEHFSKYGLTDSDEEEDVPDVIKRQLAKQALQGQAQVSKPAVSGAGLGGIGGAGLGGIGGLGGGGLIPEHNMFALQQTSVNLNLLNGSKVLSTAFEMDTTEDNNNEAPSLYLDNRAFGVKSPTSELARLEHRQSHNVQLMKASLYADTEMDDAASVSTGDQLVPVSASAAPLTSLSASLIQERAESVSADVVMHEREEVPLKPLIIRPHTIVLKYHRKVPPFSKTIAGRLGAACIADMSVCRARHSRVGFGPGANMVYATTYDAVNDLPNCAELSDLGKYVQGRTANDWSEPVVVRMAIGQAEKDDTMLEMLKLHLSTLLEHSSLSAAKEESCPMLVVSPSPEDREAILQKYMKHCRDSSDNKFGVSAQYCQSVWKLCDALWGQELANDGIPPTDLLSTVNRHKKLLEWLKSAIDEITDQELSTPHPGEEQDEEDGHSIQVWTLLLGGRILEACKVAKEHGDLNMAMLIAQAAGDPTFRSLIARQLSQWRECGAENLISSSKWCCLLLISGQSTALDKLTDAHWLTAVHATARYLCGHVPSLEQIMKKYESLFINRTEEEDIDLSIMENNKTDMKLPLPSYAKEYDVSVEKNGTKRCILDLRYELLRAKAYNDRPKLQPAAYSPDPMDYSLCFLLGAWFGSPSVESVVGIAHQLEAWGAWHLAVQALAYHSNEIARGHLIRGVLSRHAPSQANTPEAEAQLQLIEKLKIPKKWLKLAMAHRAKYEHLPALEAAHLADAGQWNAAHKVLLEELLPEAVLSDDLQSISSLLERMSEAAARHEVSGWENGGQALHLYLHVCEEIRGLVSQAEGSGQERSSVSTRLEALRPRVAAACRALGGLHPTSGRGCAARAEMGGRLVQLSLAAGEPAPHTAALLRALRLPPDTTPHAHYKISTVLAERASTPPSSAVA